MKYHVQFDIDLKRNEYPGIFIALEGIDASGKSTQAQRLFDALTKQGMKVVVKNPFEGEIGQFVRKILAGEKKVHPVALQYLIAANRQLQQSEIIEHLQKGDIVIIDRYVWSAIAYGILDVDGDMEKTSQWFLIAQSILSLYHQFLMPNYIFYLDVSFETATKRLSGMEKAKEIYEEEEKIKKITFIYKWLVKSYPREFVVINGEQSVEEVTEEIAKSLKLPK